MRHHQIGASYHIERAIAFRQGFPEYPCACHRCRGGRARKVETVARHHHAFGQDPYLPYLVLVSRWYVDLKILLV
jgi:hypothetical protein